MKFEIKLKNQSNVANSNICTVPLEKSKDKNFYSETLEKAKEEKIECIYFNGIILEETPSASFERTTNIERIIINFLKANEFPKKVCIICENQETLTNYMRVYNFWFANDKNSRLNNGSWD